MQLKFRRVQPTKNRKGFVLPPLIIIVVVFLTTHYARQKDADAVASSLQTVNKHIVVEEQIPVFELAPPFSTHQLPHLTPINPSHLVPTGSYPIDIAHKNGYLHEGHVLVCCLLIVSYFGIIYNACIYYLIILTKCLHPIH